MVLGPAVRVGLVQVQVGAVEVARPARVPLTAHRVRRALDRGGVHIAHPVAQRHDRLGGHPGAFVQLGTERRGSGGREHLEEPRTVLARPLVELADEGGGGARTAVELALQAERQRLAVALERGGHRVQPVHDRRPVLVGLGRCHGEHLTDTVRRGGEVGDRAQLLLGVVNGEFRSEALAQQAAAAALGVAVRAGQPFGGVELRQGGAGQLGKSFLTCGEKSGRWRELSATPR